MLIWAGQPSTERILLLPPPPQVRTRASCSAQFPERFLSKMPLRIAMIFPSQAGVPLIRFFFCLFWIATFCDAISSPRTAVFPRGRVPLQDNVIGEEHFLGRLPLLATVLCSAAACPSPGPPSTRPAFSVLTIQAPAHFPPFFLSKFPCWMSLLPPLPQECGFLVRWCPLFASSLWCPSSSSSS